MEQISDLSLDGENDPFIGTKRNQKYCLFSFSWNVHLILKERCYVTGNIQDLVNSRPRFKYDTNQSVILNTSVG